MKILNSKFSIRNTTHKTVPKIQFEEIKDKILGSRYELSLVFCGNSLSRKLNRVYRQKDKATNVLSFPLSKSSGEIFIDLSVCEKERQKFSMNQKKFVVYLFIHGLLHLKGMEHGDKMAKQEQKLLNGATNNLRR